MSQRSMALWPAGGSLVRTALHPESLPLKPETHPQDAAQDRQCSTAKTRPKTVRHRAGGGHWHNLVLTNRFNDICRSERIAGIQPQA